MRRAHLRRQGARAAARPKVRGAAARVGSGKYRLVPAMRTAFVREGHTCDHAVQRCDAPSSHARPRRATPRRTLVTRAATACNAATHPGHTRGHAVQHRDAPWSRVRPRRATLRRTLVTCATTACNAATHPGHTCGHAVQHVPLCESHVRLTERPEAAYFCHEIEGRETSGFGGCRRCGRAG